MAVFSPLQLHSAVWPSLGRPYILMAGLLVDPQTQAGQATALRLQEATSVSFLAPHNLGVSILHFGNLSLWTTTVRACSVATSVKPYMFQSALLALPCKK